MSNLRSSRLAATTTNRAHKVARTTLTMWQTLSTATTSLTAAVLGPGRPQSGCRCRCGQRLKGKQRSKSSTYHAEMKSHRVRAGASNMLPSTDTATAASSRRCRCGSHITITINSNNKNSNTTKRTSSNISGGSLRLLHWLLLLCVFCDVGQATLRDVNLLVQPPAVRRGQSVALRCDYQLDGAPLYSIKFYRGQMEFYRYTPGEYPHTKVFQYPGIRVDEGSSNATLVLIRNVSFGLSGQFSCEVTADAPLYSTATAYAQMQVVEFPEKRPQLFTEHTRYEPGDVLRANCSTPPSRPRSELRFTINNVPITTEETQYIRTIDNLIASRLSLKLQLQAVHFVAGINGHGNGHGNGNGNGNGNGIANALVTGSGSGSGGGLVLRCTAQIGDLYQEYKEIELGTPQKDPVPARVTLSSGTGLRSFLEAYFTTSRAALTWQGAIGGITIWLSSMLALMINCSRSR
ncbi:uncharacterized protein LOC117583333 [Drosophila guanche]|uniref:Ig-like domain-containing protein n=1 Tax=Drosophila guanche TaxID=7266 RepID=A0A3B0K4X6_DROGU|nr:uncharacterized protein LOC117583333 [Drosophila guanche]SPP80676.1 Hypothetical predicted protein [Drosophila guanche]